MENTHTLINPEKVQTFPGSQIITIEYLIDFGEKTDCRFDILGNLLCASRLELARFGPESGSVTG